jgi:nucleolar GTP-binding protein
LLKIVRSSGVAARQLGLRTRRFDKPGLTPFEQELVARRFGPSALPRSLTRVRRALDRVRELSRVEQAELRRASSEPEYGDVVRRAYGRMASFLREVDDDLEQLATIGRFLDDRPQLVAGVPTVVVAGFPNVGKSSLVARLSTARPEVAAYPFTTLAISVGHADLGFDRMQVLDTPGVLGRTGQLNPAEAEAVVAVGNAGQVILFVIDPTETCGYSRADQEALLARWKQQFPTLAFIEVETKSDLRRAPSSRLQVSAKTGAGVPELQARLRELLGPLARPMDPPIEEEPPPEP